MKICIARIHGKIKYEKPLDHILDSFYEMLKKFISENPNIEFSYYNISFDSTNPTRNVDALKDASVIIIPSENAFQYHIKGYFHILQNETWFKEIEKIKPYIQNKKVILLRSDRADSEELYRTMTFKDVDFDFDIIDETDFDNNIHALKYLFIKKTQQLTDHDLIKNKDIDFIYWGCMKNKLPGGKNSGDIRHKILKHVQKNSSISSFWIGRYSNIVRDVKISSMQKILPHLAKAKSTICFNWLDDTATTSRYHESVANNIFPFVWQNYDKNNILVADEWQRVQSQEELIDKINYLKDAENFLEKFYNVKIRYNPVNFDSYYNKFYNLIMSKISG